jgi:hypothetical protein
MKIYALFFKLDFAICVPFSKQSPPTTPFLYHEDSYDVTQKHDCGAWPRRNEIKWRHFNFGLSQFSAIWWLNNQNKNKKILLSFITIRCILFLEIFLFTVQGTSYDTQYDMTFQSASLVDIKVCNLSSESHYYHIKKKNG